ncbi:hypothetical protein Vadar_031565 [Vaccinium darrowii]|uniref:Uncharacterized protein n=1 Tax=Vaccinium darrowii TaxID=229202 RepID=A0ACB7X5I8_9ERIC|nr:hypothetical protein Vadar_031565 [Vaccinium darrowii]
MFAHCEGVDQVQCYVTHPNFPGDEDEDEDEQENEDFGNDEPCGLGDDVHGIPREMNEGVTGGTRRKAWEDLGKGVIVGDNEEGEGDTDSSVESLQSFDDSDDTGNKRRGKAKVKYPEFLEERDMKNPKLVPLMLFPNVRVFRKLLKEYHLKHGCDFKYIKNESKRVTVKCSEAEDEYSCKWRLHASRVGDTTTFQIKTIQGKHTCGRKYESRWASAKWLAGKYLHNFIDDPNWKFEAVKNDVRRKLYLDVSKKQIYRAKRKAQEIVEEKYGDQYKRLYDYCEVLRRENPGSCAKIQVDRPWVDRNPIFQRIFIMFDAQVKGFVGNCRPIIGLDACFLKSPYGGQMMHAVGRDANNQMYPIAMAVVEAELKDSWSWFLEILTDGLTESMDLLFPGVEHRFCIRHMYSNYQKLFKGKELKDLMWGAASAYTVPEFEAKMRELKAMSNEAHDWLLREPIEHWARCKYSPRAQMGRMVNNLSESFNNAIKEVRDKPILTMLEGLRRYVMQRLTSYKTQLH